VTVTLHEPSRDRAPTPFEINSRVNSVLVKSYAETEFWAAAKTAKIASPAAPIVFKNEFFIFLLFFIFVATKPVQC